MGVKIRLASEFDPRGFDAAERRLASVKDKALAHSNTIAGAFMRTGGSVVQFGDRVTNTGQAVSGAGDNLTRGVTLPLVGMGALAFRTAADFEQSMNLVQAATDAPSTDMAKLTVLAKKMGADTVFSANEAAGAMLELAKSGMTPAQIQAGGLNASLQLAAAGQVGLESAATTTANALNMFGLKAKDADMVADALAGGANASSASVGSLQEALAQVGPGAVNAGMTLQQTVGVLAAFADRGIQGSDAGTSLKTMLTRLVPATDKAELAMKRYGLSFVDSKGNIDSIETVAQKLQKRLGGLSEEQRSAALATIFGSDATRAASVLMGLGAQGTEKYVKATQDREAAERMADAAMKGSKGSIEQMKGSVETAALGVGQSLAPAITDLAGNIKSLADSFAALTPKQQQTIIKFALVAAAAGPVLSVLGRVTSALGGVVKGIGYTITGAGRFIGGLKGAEGAASTFAGKLGLGVSKLGSWAKTAGSTALTAARNLASGIGSLAKNIATTIVDLGRAAAAWVADTARKAANTAATWAGIVASKAAALGAKLWAGAQWLLNAAMTANPIGLVVAAIVGLVAAFAYAWTHSEKFREILTNGWNVIKTAAVSIFTGIVNFFKQWGPWMIAALLGPVGLVGKLVIDNWDKIKTATAAVWGKVTGFLTGVWTKIKAVASSVWTGLLGFFKKWGPWMLAALAGPIGLVVKLLAGNWDKIKAGAVKVWTGLVTFIKGIPAKIMSSLGNLGRLLYNAGKAVLQGFWDGLKSIWSKVTGWVSGIGKWIADHKGPISYDRQLLKPAGAAIMGGFFDSLAAGRAPVERLLDDFTQRIGAYSASPSAAFTPAFAGSGMSGGGRSVVIGSGAVQIQVTASPGTTIEDARRAGAAAAQAFMARVIREMEAG